MGRTHTTAIFTFINRKTILSFSDPFPIELGMLISGFWVNNMTDMVSSSSTPFFVFFFFFF